MLRCLRLKVLNLGLRLKQEETCHRGNHRLELAVFQKGLLDFAWQEAQARHPRLAVAFRMESADFLSLAELAHRLALLEYHQALIQVHQG